jgi:NTP pyrophosphatase (non-canonical NTP hydrolase)
MSLQNERPDRENSFISWWEWLAERVHADNVKKGFWPNDPTQRNFGEAIALIHSELSEALEGHRHGNPPSDHLPEYSAIEEELADTVIRILDLSTVFAPNIADCIIDKLEYNRNRPFKHGKSC